MTAASTHLSPTIEFFNSFNLDDCNFYQELSIPRVNVDQVASSSSTSSPLVDQIFSPEVLLKSKLFQTESFLNNFNIDFSPIQSYPPSPFQNSGLMENFISTSPVVMMSQGLNSPELLLSHNFSLNDADFLFQSDPIPQHQFDLKIKTAKRAGARPYNVNHNSYSPKRQLNSATTSPFTLPSSPFALPSPPFGLTSPNLPESLFGSPQSDLSFFSPQVSPRYFDDINLNMPSFRCAYADCYESYLSSEELQYHLITVHQNQTPEKEKLFKCQVELCQKVFSRSHDMKRHMTLSHTDFRPLHCPRCKKGYVRPDQLRNHILSFQQGKKKSNCVVERTTAP